MCRRTGSPWARWAAASLAAAALASSCTEAREVQPDAEAARPSITAATTPSLTVDLARVRGFATTGRARPRRLRPPARSVRDTIDRLYTAAFVDPGAWRGGRFPEALAEFRGSARRQARMDVDRLTLGKAFARLVEVEPRRARVGVDLLLDARRNPVAAVARMRFSASGLSDDGVRSPIRHRAQYVLRRFGGRWKIVAYRVERRLVPTDVPGVPIRGTLFVLAIGSDARPGQSVARARADSIHIIGVNLRREKASILGIPRDSYVHVPGAGSQKINAALFHGGPQLVVRTVEALTGIRMDGYLLTGFKGFRRMVSLIGGLEVRVPYRMSDAASNAFFDPGPAKLNGRKALAFSRNRHDAPGGDFGRSLNQGAVLLAALRELRGDVARDPTTLFRWVTIASQHLETDLTGMERLELLLAGLSIDPAKVRNRVVSGGGGFVGSQSVVRLGSGAGAMFRDLRRDGLLGH